MIATHKVDEITFDKDFIYLHANGKSYKIAIVSVSSKLEAADTIQRNFYKISPSGYGIHWPLIDEDLSVDFLLKASL